MPSGEALHFGTASTGPSATVHLKSWRALLKLAIGGDVGFAEAYIAGLWDSPNLTAVIELGARNLDQLDDGIRQSWLARQRDRILHLMNANTRRGSRRNIMRHYDLGNDFYRLWLDEAMNYSSGIYATGTETLAQAQGLKNARIIELLGIRPGQSLLEIGCGWGALAEMLTRDRGVIYKGLTLSPSQKRIADTRIGALGSIALEDYRDCKGSFDRIASVEMIEAVGEENWPTYFSAIRERLAPGGRAVIQAITIAERRYHGYAQGVDFIQKHIFPGGNLPTVSHIREQAARAGLTLDHEERFGLGYAETLVAWRERFEAAWPEIKALGFDERFRRLWTYYLAYCEGGFRAGTIDVGLYRLSRA